MDDTPAFRTAEGISITQNPDGTNTQTTTIIGGGKIEIEGVVDLPRQTIRITGNGEINQNVDRFALVANNIDIEGNGQLYINMSGSLSTMGDLAGGGSSFGGDFRLSK